jgi:ubiquinone/menaquinone biosynthesis C-methylase UbiE
MEAYQNSISAKSVDNSGFIKQEDIVKNFSIAKGMKVADLGCGAGYFTIPIAKLLGNSGKIYAIDVLSTALEFVESQAKLFGFMNVETVRANIEVLGGTKIPDHSVDLVLLANILFQCNDPDAALQEAKRIVSSEGRIVVIDWVPDKFFLGPKFNKCISEEDSKKLAIRNGLRVVKEVPTGKMNYGFMLQSI